MKVAIFQTNVAVARMVHALFFKTALVVVDHETLVTERSMHSDVVNIL